MTSFEAYDEGLPCKNPNCKSHGSPHPNCKCYGGMAEGGEVKSFCSTNQPHHKLCEHYAEGGPVDLSNIMQPQDPEAAVSSYLIHNGLHGLLDFGKNDSDQSIMKYNQNIKSGNKTIQTKLDSLFGNNTSDKMDPVKGKEKINSWIENGGITKELQDEQGKQNITQQFAGGGHVQAPEGLPHNSLVAQAYPSQNIMLQAAKGRMSTYLSGLKPQQNVPKLAFDDKPDSRKQEKSYDRALHVAADPLHVMDQIKAGTIEPEHLGHFKSMYPEVDQHLQKKLTEKIIQAQLKDEKPSRNVRQGLSMFMGTPLSGELTPQSMQAAQATFQTQQPAAPQGQPAGKSKDSKQSLSKSDQSFLTGGQALAARQQKQ